MPNKNIKITSATKSRGFRWDRQKAAAPYVDRYTNRNSMKKIIGVILLLLMQASIADSEERVSKEFVIKVAKAQAITSTDNGAMYDRELSAYFMSLPATETGMNNCLSKHAGPQWVIGFFEFTKAGEYSFQLEPISSFSKCLEKVFNLKNPPKPPMLPYLNSFSFEYEG